MPASSDAIQSRMPEKITSGWLTREDLGEGLAFALALKSRENVDIWSEKVEARSSQGPEAPMSWEGLCRPGGGLEHNAKDTRWSG